MRCALPLLAGLLAATGVSFAGSPADDAGLMRVTRQFRAFYLLPGDPFAVRGTGEAPPDLSAALGAAKALQPDGTWQEIDYRSTARSAWPPGTHANRILAMAIAAERSASPEDRDRLLDATHRAFRNWAGRDYQCTNWWYNQIGIPAILGEAGIVLGDDLKPDEKAYLTGTLLARYPIAMTGQNRIWLACNSLMRGLLLEDPAIVEPAASTLWSEVAVTTDEGLQPDFSFHQHGPQQQMGNYGMGFAAEESRMSVILRDSPWAMPPEKQALFRRYLLQGLGWVDWRGFWDVSACDRQKFPGSQLSKASSLRGILTLEAQADHAYAGDYLAAADRGVAGAPNDLVGDTYFWRSDYYLHRARDYAFTLKMSSSRVIGEETVNSENLSGVHAAEGALYSYATGAEYLDIFPVWDWKRIPGVTCQVATLPPIKGRERMPTDFVGGLASGGRGLATLDYARDGVRARKAWFFGPFGVVCLGAGISADAGIPVETTVDQRLLAGAVDVVAIRAGAQDRRFADSADAVLEAPVAVTHDGWTVTFLDANRVHLRTGPSTGSWRSVFQNPATPKAPVTRKLFLLGIDHGTKPSEAHYAYAMGRALFTNEATVLANEPSVQAVAFDRATQVVFWKPGSLKTPNGELSVSAPCLVELEPEGIAVSDPTQRQSSLDVTLSATGAPSLVFVVDLPQGPRAGSTVRVPLSAAHPTVRR